VGFHVARHFRKISLGGGFWDEFLTFFLTNRVKANVERLVFSYIHVEGTLHSFHSCSRCLMTHHFLHRFRVFRNYWVISWMPVSRFLCHFSYLPRHTLRFISSYSILGENSWLESFLLLLFQGRFASHSFLEIVLPLVEFPCRFV